MVVFGGGMGMSSSWQPLLVIVCNGLNVEIMEKSLNCVSMFICEPCLQQHAILFIARSVD